MDPAGEPPTLKALRRRRRRQRRVLILVGALFLSGWLLFAGAHRGDTSLLIASAIRPSVGPPGTALPTPPNMAQERGELHLMLGRGRLIVFSSTFYSGAFSSKESKALAWIVVTRQSNPLVSLRAAPGQPILDLPTRTVPTVLTPLCGLLAWCSWRGRVRRGCCVGCGYDLSATEGTTCPECGLAQPTQIAT